MAASVVILPPDTGNTGKNVQVFQNTISATVVQALGVVPCTSAGLAQDNLANALYSRLSDLTTAQIIAAAATLAQANSGVGALIATTPGMTMKSHAPAVNTQATISAAAGSAGVRHVCTSISIGLANDATGTVQTGLAFTLRDGATGAGTILGTWTLSVIATAGACQVLTLNNLSVFGSAATAMTLENTGTPAVHTAAFVVFTYFDVV